MFNLIVFLALIAGVSSRCQDSNPSCVQWARNGFCTSSFYRDQVGLCPATCGLCVNGNCVDRNVTDCINWVINGFCDLKTTKYSVAQIMTYCPASCGYCN